MSRLSLPTDLLADEPHGDGLDIPVGVLEQGMKQDAEDYRRHMARLGAHNARLRDAAQPAPFVPFPTDQLPPAVAAHTAASACALGCDEALVALPTLSVLAAGVGNSHRIALKSSWEEPAMVWTAIVSPSGTSKSPALYAAAEPIHVLEREAQQEYDDRMSLYEIEARTHAAERKTRPDAAPPVPPTRLRYRIGDTTVEGIAAVHAVNPRGLLVVRDEGGGWLGARDRYASGDADRYNWNELGGGRQIVIDRKTSQSGVLTIERPAVSVAVGLQPGVLAGQLTAADFVSGFAARLLMAQPPTRARRWTDASVTADVLADYHALVRALYARARGGDALPLTTEARDLFRAWVNDNGQKMARLHEADPLRSAFSKTEAYAARFALTFHLSDIVGRILPVAAPPPVSAAAMRAGIAVACWFRYELARLYDLHGFRQPAGRGAVDRDEALAARLPIPFTVADVEALWKVGQSAAYETMKRLERKGLVEKLRSGQYRATVTPPEESEFPEKLESASLLHVDRA